MEYVIFVDLENVPNVDLGSIEGKPVHVTLLIGKRQTSMNLALVQQIHRMSKQIALVEVGATGPNALDITLASYLGRALERSSGAHFAIISKDTDFKPMIEHWKTKGVQIVRENSLSALSFLRPPRSASTKSKPPFKLSNATLPAHEKPASPTKADKFARFVSHLRSSPPSNRTKLVHAITAFFKPSLPGGGVEGVIARLQNEKILTVDSDNSVTISSIAPK